jgi:hypothetical protein
MKKLFMVILHLIKILLLFPFLFAHVGLGPHSPTFTSCVAGITGMHHLTWLFKNTCLLAYVNFTKGFNYDNSIYMHIMYFEQITPLLLFFILPLPLILFSYMHVRFFDHIYLPFMLSFHPPPSHWLPLSSSHLHFILL